jgi:hypothetical protein
MIMRILAGQHPNAHDVHIATDSWSGGAVVLLLVIIVIIWLKPKKKKK